MNADMVMNSVFPTKNKTKLCSIQINNNKKIRDFLIFKNNAIKLDLSFVFSIVFEWGKSGVKATTTSN